MRQWLYFLDNWLLGFLIFELGFYNLRPNHTALRWRMLQCAHSHGHMRALRHVKRVFMLAENIRST
jgi:hypothetical protein